MKATGSTVICISISGSVVDRGMGGLVDEWIDRLMNGWMMTVFMDNGWMDR